MFLMVQKRFTPHFNTMAIISQSDRDRFNVRISRRLFFTAIMRASGQSRQGNDLVNNRDSNIEWGMKGNFLDVPKTAAKNKTDRGCTGICAYWLIPRVLPKYLYEYQEQLLYNGRIVPTFGPTKCSCAWGDAACIIPWNVIESDVKQLRKPKMMNMKGRWDYIRRIDGTSSRMEHFFH